MPSREIVFNGLNAERAGRWVEFQPTARHGVPMHHHGELQARIDALCDRAREADADQALLAEMEYVLAEGYARALAAEAEIVRLGRRENELIEDLDERKVPAIRRLDAERRGLEQSAARLRARLAFMQIRFAELGKRSRPQTSSSVSP